MSERDADVVGWVQGRLPEGWFVGPAEVSVDREEIVVVGRLEAPEGAEDTEAAGEGRIARFREDTRDERIGIAQEAERRFGRKVAWGAECGPASAMFTHLAVPVMTRLRQPERLVLDTLVEAGVARSRAHALAWCVHLVGEHTDDWLSRLRDAMTEVRRVREEGPGAA